MAMVPPASQTAPPTLHAALSTSTAGPSASGYAQPISMLWQKTSPEWVAKLHAAADAKDRAAERKQMNLELEAQARQTIMGSRQNGRLPFGYPVSLKSFPFFRINDHPNILEGILTDGSLAPPSCVEVYNADRDRWDCLPIDQPYQVQAEETLLFRILPNGINGPRLEDCPRRNVYKHHQYPQLEVRLLSLARMYILRGPPNISSESIIPRRREALLQQGKGGSALLALMLLEQRMATLNGFCQPPIRISTPFRHQDQ